MTTKKSVLGWEIITMELFVLYLLNGRKGQRAPRFDYYFSDKVHTGIKGRFPLPSRVCSPSSEYVISTVKRQIAFIHKNRSPRLGCRVGDLGRETDSLSLENCLYFYRNLLRHILIEF